MAPDAPLLRSVVVSVLGVDFPLVWMMILGFVELEAVAAVFPDEWTGVLDLLAVLA